MRERKLDSKAREVIKQYIRDHGEMTTEEIKALIAPHYNYNPQRLRDQDLGRVANQIVASIKDESGARAVFNCKEDGVSRYVNIDTTQDLESVKEVDRQISEKFYGLNASKMKVERRRRELEGQIKMDLASMM